MIEQIQLYLAGLPTFFSYFAIGGMLMLACITIYNRMTPLDEWALIKQGDTAAAIAFSGSLLGFVIPLASAIANAQSNLECILWGAIAVLIQLIAFFCVRLFLPSISERIKCGDTASGILLAAISLSVGLLNAASMTY